MRVNLRNSQGAILIISLWVLIILSAFAIALAQRASLEIKLAKYQRDILKAKELANAAIERAIWEKEKCNEEKSPGINIDALSQSWGRNEEAFKNAELGNETFTGTFTVSHCLDGQSFYGLEDERSKININRIGGTIPKKVLINLLKDCGVEEEIAGDITNSIIVWRTTTEESGENDNYGGLSYKCKSGEFKTIPELLLVRYGMGEDEGITPRILYGEDEDGDGKISSEEEGVAKYLTVFPYPSSSPSTEKGGVNINTASKKVLKALISGATSLDEANSINLVEDIICPYRRGFDGEIGTDDDGWFSESPIEREGEVINLNTITNHMDPFFPLRQLKNQGLISVHSDIYTIHAQAEVKKAKKSITTTVKLGPNREDIEYLYWYVE